MGGQPRCEKKRVCSAAAAVAAAAWELIAAGPPVRAPVAVCEVRAARGVLISAVPPPSKARARLHPPRPFRSRRCC